MTRSGLRISKWASRAAILLIASMLPDPSFAQPPINVAQIGGTGIDAALQMTLDGSGNLYAVGLFEGSADFHLISGTVTLTSIGPRDAFVLKLDSSGNLVWLRQVGGTGKVEANDVAVDGSGNVHVAGIFEGVADFNPGAGVFTMASPGRDGFVLKLDSAGDFLWAAQTVVTSPVGDVILTGVEVDGAGNVYAAGHFSGSVDWDPSLLTSSLTSFGGLDVVVWKLDSGGNLVWVARAGGTTWEEGLQMALDGAGNVYTVGRFADTADFDPGAGTFNLTSFGTRDAFIWKLDGGGNLIFAKQMGGAGSFTEAWDTVVDAGGNLITVGHFSGTADFDPGGGTVGMTSLGMDAFVQKLDSLGDFVWARQTQVTSLTSGVEIKAVDTDGTGNLYLGGFFFGTADFDPGGSTFNLTASGPLGGGDGIAWQLDTNGNFVSVLQFESTFFSFVTDTLVEPSGNVQLAGFFADTTDFDPGPGTVNRTAAGSIDAFIWTLDSPIVASHLKCFDVEDAPNIFRKKLRRTIVDLLSPQFGLDANCRMIKATRFCAPVEKTIRRTPLNIIPFNGPALATDFICYKISCENLMPDLEVTDQFGFRTIFQKTTEQELCVPAIKGMFDPNSPSDPNAPSDPNGP